MSVYDDLNEWRVDESDYEPETLTELERERWARRVEGKLKQRGGSIVRKRRRRKVAKALMAAIAASAVLIGVTLPAGQAALARLPFVAGLLESFAGNGEHVDYSAYKTQIGETAENSFGRLTLDEILVDTDRLLIVSTLEPSEAMNVEEGDVLYLDATVTLNGKSGEKGWGGSGAGSDGKNGVYTTYQSIPLQAIPHEEKLDITVRYDRISWIEPKGRPTQPPEPWSFRIQASRSALLAQTHTVEINRTLDLINGDQVVVQKVVSSPVSTRVYYQITKQAEQSTGLYLSGFKLVSDNGTEAAFKESRWGQGSSGYALYAPVDWKKGQYSLIPYDLAKEKALGEAVPIAP